VEAFAHRYGRQGAEVEDLIQVGSIGLLGAIERFDPKRGGEFAAFAVPTIAGEIKRHLRDRTGAVHLPRRLREAEMRLPKTREQLTGRLGRPPAPDELANELGVEPSDIAVLEHNGRPSDGDAAEAAAAADTDLDERILLADAFGALDETERSIVYTRFIRDLSRRDAAKELGMTEDRLRRRTQLALSKLRGELERGASPVARSEPTEITREEPAPADGAPGNAEPVEAPARAEHSGRFLLRMRPTLHDDLAAAAEREGISLNQFINNALSSALDDSEPPAAGEQGQPRWLRAAIVTNIVVLALAALTAMVLLLVAWQQG
jgi:RNA polymerase sigma factor (sigma-70 family)